MTDPVVKTQAQIAEENRVKQEQAAKAAQPLATTVTKDVAAALQAKRDAHIDQQIASTASASVGAAGIAGLNVQANEEHAAITDRVAHEAMAIQAGTASPPTAEELVKRAQQRNEATAKAQAEVTKPKLLSPSHVLFRSSRPNLGASGPNGIIRFHDGYAQTDNQADIKYLDENKAHFGIQRA